MLEQDELIVAVNASLTPVYRTRFQLSAGPVSVVLLASTFTVLVAVALVFLHGGLSPRVPIDSTAAEPLFEHERGFLGSNPR